MIALDTNLLIYAHRTESECHQPALELIERASGLPAGWGIGFPSIAEFWSNVTHPNYPGGSSSSLKASRFLSFLEKELGMAVFLPTEDFSIRLAREAQRRRHL